MILDARTTNHQVMSVQGTRVSVTYHTPQHLHRLTMEDWNQLRESGFPVDRVWEQGMPLRDIHDEEEGEYSYSLMNVGCTSQASEVENSGRNHPRIGC